MKSEDITSYRIVFRSSYNHDGNHFLVAIRGEGKYAKYISLDRKQAKELVNNLSKALKKTEKAYKKEFLED